MTMLHNEATKMHVSQSYMKIIHHFICLAIELQNFSIDAGHLVHTSCCVNWYKQIPVFWRSAVTSISVLWCVKWTGYQLQTVRLHHHKHIMWYLTRQLPFILLLFRYFQMFIMPLTAIKVVDSDALLYCWNVSPKIYTVMLHRGTWHCATGSAVPNISKKHCATGSVVPNISKKQSAFILKGLGIQE